MILASLVILGGAVLALGAWFGGIRDPRALLAMAAFAVASLAWLWLASREKSATAAATAAA